MRVWDYSNLFQHSSIRNFNAIWPARQEPPRRRRPEPGSARPARCRRGLAKDRRARAGRGVYLRQREPRPSVDDHLSILSPSATISATSCARMRVPFTQGVPESAASSTVKVFGERRARRAAAGERLDLRRAGPHRVAPIPDTARKHSRQTEPTSHCEYQDQSTVLRHCPHLKSAGAPLRQPARTSSVRRVFSVKSAATLSYGQSEDAATRPPARPHDLRHVRFHTLTPSRNIPTSLQKLIFDRCPN